MNFKNPLLVAICFTLALISTKNAIAQGGSKGGGGGKAVVCRNSAGKISKAEVLDVFEAKNLFGLNPIVFAGNLDYAVKELKSDLMKTMDQPEVHLLPLVEHVRKIFRLVGSNAVLKPVDDAAEVIIPVGCNFEQLANYVDDDLLLVSEEIWNALDITNQAALIMHEAIYRLERYYGATDSRRSRKVVAHLISGFPFIQVRAGVPQNWSGSCMARMDDQMTFNFDYYPNSLGNTVMQFYWFERKPVYSKKTAVVPMTVREFGGKWPDVHWPTSNVTCTPIPGKTVSCNFSGGDTSSNFEGSGFITLGVELDVVNHIVNEKRYLLTSTGRHYLECW